MPSNFMTSKLMHIGAIIGDAFLDQGGGVSSMRILCVLTCVVIFGMWITFSFIEGRYIPFGIPEAGLISVALGAKAVQTRSELGTGGLKSFNLRDSLEAENE